ncbi:MAG: MFS transporter [Rhodospirillaceae bacterium]
MSTRPMTIGLWLVALAGCAVASINLGTRVTFGLYQTDILRDISITPMEFGFALALQNLVWGLATPVMGAVADKYGSLKMMALGTLLYAAGLWVMGSAESLFAVNVGLGVLVGMGMGGTGFGVVLGAVGRRAPTEHRSTMLGIAAAGGSVGQFYMAPVGQALAASGGWTGALFALAGIMLICIPFAYLMTREPLTEDARSATGAGANQQNLGQALGEAYGHLGYTLLTLGFFVCGFQIAFITVHFPKYLELIGLTGAAVSVPGLGVSTTLAALSLSAIGFFNIIGTYGCGVLGGKFLKKWILSWLYALRAVCIVVILLSPKTEANILIFAAVMGLLWLGTVPLTSGLVANMFGVRYLSTLFGIVFFSHQVGSFIGVWLGGYLLETTGSYDPVWWGAVALGFIAAALHLPIPERRESPAAA